MPAEDLPTDLLPPSEEQPVKPASATPRTLPPAAANLVGRSLGKFDIIEQLGRGGSGDVYMASQAALGRACVVKVLRREHAATSNRVERFLREAKLASRLDHPYAAHIYAFGAEPDGVLWIAMELVRGATLDELIARRGAVPPSIFAPLFGRLCEVVHTAHELGIVHRDIKGSNVMVIERAGQLLPKLLDFGIAKLDGRDDVAIASEETLDELGSGDLTAQGATLGSPHYMSPEQWTAASQVDSRADIYALGVLAYRCIAGHLPFRVIDRKELADAHLHHAPPPLPDSVPVPLADAILRALEKLPDDRWATALAFGEAVRFAVGSAAPEAVSIFDPYTREVWLRAGPQPIADAISRLASARTTVESDASLRELVAITCRWLAVLALSTSEAHEARDPHAPPDSVSGQRRASTLSGSTSSMRERARRVVGTDDALPWLELARAAAGSAASSLAFAGLAAALAGSEPLAALAEALDDHNRSRTAAALAADIAAAADALRPIEPLLAYQLVVGRGDGTAESWIGIRRRDRDAVMVWGSSDSGLADGEVALLDASGKVVARLSPFAQVIAPLPSAEPELFLLWRSGRGRARLVAAPWGFERDDDAAGEFLAALSTEDGDTSHDPADDASPYPGLAAYGVDDAERFVGREREIEALTNRLVRAPMLAVLGPSGAGKSSFVHAGVLPRLAEAGYRIVTMRPGRHPMHALAAVTDGDASAIQLRALGEAAARGLVVVINQLEELVTLCDDPAERTRFADTLAAAADGSRAPVRVVVTLRDDFAAVTESEESLRGRFEVFVLGTPLPEALRRIVVEPARRAAVAVEPGVVDDMVAEVAGRPASLPLLSFTAAELWRTRDKPARRITHAAYLALGGVAGALSTYADQVYESLAHGDQRVVRSLFARLVASDGTRIPAPRAELEQLPGTAPVLAHLIDARLLVVREDDDSHATIEIVHECLAERWDRLARWRREDAADRALLGDVRAAARRWHDANNSRDMLWRGDALAELRKLRARSAGLTDAERAFADASDASARNARKLRIGLVAVAMASLAGVAVTLAYLGVAANRSADRAQISAQLAEQRLTDSLVAQGRRELNDGHDLPALAYFAEALRRGADSPALRQMIAYGDRGTRFERVVVRGANPSLASDGKRFAFGDSDGRLRLYAPSGAVIGSVATPVGPLGYLHFEADGTLVACGTTGIVLIDPDTQTVLATIKTPFPSWTAHRGPGKDELGVVGADGFSVLALDGSVRRTFNAPQAMADSEAVIDATGRWLMFSRDHEVHDLDLTTMTDHVLPGHLASPFGNPNGTARGMFDKDGTLHLVDADGKQRLTIKSPSGHPVSLVFADDGSEVALVDEHELYIFDTKDGSPKGQVSVDEAESQIAIRGDEAWLGGLDGVLRAYHEGRLVASQPGHLTQIMSIALAGDAVGTVSSDDTFRISDAGARHLVVGDPPCPQISGYGPLGAIVTYGCGDKIHLLVGREEVGVVANGELDVGSYDPELGRVAVISRQTLVVFERGKEVARATGDAHLGPIGFADADHLWVTPGNLNLGTGSGSDAGIGGLWRWAYRTDTWERVVAGLTRTSSVVGLADGRAVVGFIDGHVTFYEGAREVARLELGRRVDQLDVSSDQRHLIATMDNGEAAILDAVNPGIERRLPAAEAIGAASTFDATGDFVLRLARGGLKLTDRATGTDILFNADLLRTVMGGRQLADGRLEVDSDRPALLDIPRDTRSREAIIGAIECRVPLRVVDSRLEPAEPRCAP